MNGLNYFLCVSMSNRELKGPCRAAQGGRTGSSASFGGHELLGGCRMRWDGAAKTFLLLELLHLLSQCSYFSKAVERCHVPHAACWTFVIVSWRKTAVPIELLSLWEHVLIPCQAEIRQAGLHGSNNWPELV